jgi:hypothetical protein
VFPGALLLAAGCAVAPALAQERLGEQRAGTSAGTFLKISVDPRGAAMGGAAIALAEGIASLSWNPAGLTTLEDPELMFAYVRWPGDIDYTYFAAGSYSTPARGTLGVQMGYLGTIMEETTERNPYGTGRSFGFRDWFLGISYARRFTDRLSFGITGRFVREDLATEIGGPSVNNWLIDAGTRYLIDFLDTRLAFAIQSFGPEFAPGGSYVSQVTGEPTDYQTFAPPSTFKLGLSSQPLSRENMKVRTAAELNHFSDSAETLRFGAEISLQDQLHLRTGYDMNADAMRFTAGVGVDTRFGLNAGHVDYAYTDAGSLGEVHRLAIRLTI